MMKTKKLNILSLVAVLLMVGCAHQAGRSQHDAHAMMAGQQVPDELLAKRRVYFDFDRASVRHADLEVLAAHAEYLKHNPNCRVRIEGHTDEKGSREYNVALGEKRAKAVADALVMHGASKDQIIIVSYGKEKLDAKGHDEKAHCLNRRAVIMYGEE